MFKQDDPNKCTAAKLIKFALAKGIRKTSNNSIILDPFAPKFLIPSDNNLANSITAIDCSWNLADSIFSKQFLGISRKLPFLLAGNPVNYAKLNKLTTVEAISAALYLLGYKNDSLKLLDKFKWGHTFYDLNRNLLEDYCNIKHQDEIGSIASEYNLV